MELIEQLEYPVPILKVDTDKIVIEASTSVSGKLIVENIGGGRLEGGVMSNSSALLFAEGGFEGNRAELEYYTVLDGFKAGDLIRSDAVITSNGGEAVISIVIKVISSVVTTTEGLKITTLKDFVAFAKKNPIEARQIFVSKEFMIWLMSLDYEFMDIFDYIIQDPNKERALENFFILNKLKNKAQLTVSEKLIIHEALPYQKEKLTGVIRVKKSGWGYIDCPVSVVDSPHWLTLKPSVLNSASFNENEIAEIVYTIDPALLNMPLTTAKISLAETADIDIRIKKKPLIEFRLQRENFLPDDDGLLIIVNNSKTDVMIDILPKDGFVKFEGKKYFIGEYAEILFKVKLTGIQTAQMAIKRQPTISTEILIKANFENMPVRKSFNITIGDFI